MVVTEVVDRLAVELALGLAAVALPLVHVAVRTGQIHREAVVVAGVQPRIGAPGTVAAEALRHGDAVFGRRVGRIELHGAAQVAGRRRAECTDALGQLGATEILGDQRATDVQAVLVAVAHVAQRDAVESEAQPVLVETAQADAGRPLVVAEWIGRLEVHARLALQDLQRAGARRQDLHVLGGDALHLARLALTDHRDGIECLGAARIQRRSHRLCRRGGIVARRLDGGTMQRGKQRQCHGGLADRDHAFGHAGTSFVRRPREGSATAPWGGWVGRRQPAGCRSAPS